MDQKPAGIKAAPASAAARAFVLWMALLLLYFLILPSAAESGPSAGAMPRAEGRAGTAAAAARLGRRAGPFAEAAVVSAALD